MKIKKQGHHNVGASNPRTKLTDKYVREIRALAERGVDRKEIADEYGISRSAVEAIINRRTWAHVE